MDNTQAPFMLIENLLCFTSTVAFSSIPSIKGSLITRAIAQQCQVTTLEKQSQSNVGKHRTSAEMLTQVKETVN